MAKRRNYRQGDVFLFQVIGTLHRASTHGPVVALGEVTGHRHELEGCDVWCDAEGKLYCRVKAGERGVLRHLTQENQQAEHLPVELAPDVDYRVVIQEEYQPEGWRRVAD